MLGFFHQKQSEVSFSHKFMRFGRRSKRIGNTGNIGNTDLNDPLMTSPGTVNV
jgi:hypothetical protein